MGFEILKIGDKVEIEDVEKGMNASSEAGKFSYVSQIYQIVDGEHLRILMPFQGEKLVLLETNLRYHLCVYNSNGLFKCVAQVTDRFKSENYYIAEVVIKSGLRRVQRREYYRLEKLLEIEYRQLSEIEESYRSAEEVREHEMLGIRYQSALAVDLSGGGARMVMNESFEIDTYLMIKMKIGVQSNDICLVANVLMCSPMKTDQTKYEVRVKFVKIREYEREKLIKYIFEEERKLRQKEKS